MDQIPPLPYKIPRDAHQRELAAINPTMYRPIPPALRPLMPILKAIYRQTAPREPEKTANTTEQEKPLGSLLSTERAAQYLDISPETLRRLCKRQVITFIRVTPHEYRFDLADLDEYKNSRRNHRKSAVKKSR
jgi:excisionase family DNA binding protein